MTVVVEADAGVLFRLLQPFLSHNVIPHRILAERFEEDWMRVEFEIRELSPESFRRIVAKTGQLPTVLSVATGDQANDQPIARPGLV